jgi:hypothetical protein
LLGGREGGGWIEKRYGGDVGQVLSRTAGESGDGTEKCTQRCHQRGTRPFPFALKERNKAHVPWLG